MSRRSHSLPGLGSMEVVSSDPDYITHLVSDVRQFAVVLLNLKEAFNAKDEGVTATVNERLSELLRVLKLLIGKHQTLNSEEILSAAGTLITKVKGLNLKDVNKDNRSGDFQEIYTSIDTLAFTFGNVVSDFLMGDVDSNSSVEQSQIRKSKSFENLSGGSGECSKVQPESALHTFPERSSVERVDQVLLQNDSGVESALLYAKAWSKYAKDVLSWVEKRLSLDIECARSFAKLAESAKTVTSQQDYMPFKGVYMAAFDSELDHSQALLQTAAALQTNKFIQPLVARRNELDKKRKELKEQWQREQKKMSEAESAVRKAQLLHNQRRDEHEKARRMGDEQMYGGGKALEKKRKMEEEALQKVEEAQDQYKACVIDAECKRSNLEKSKSEILIQLRELIFQCDLTLKAVTVNWFQMLHIQMGPTPQKYQALCDQVKQYDPGQCYSEFVHSLPKERVWLEALSQQGSGSSRTGRSLSSQHSYQGALFQKNLLQGTLSQGNLFLASSDEVDDVSLKHLSRLDDQMSNSVMDIHGVKQQGGSGMCSDSESAGGSSESRSVDSPTASPGDFKRRLPRTPSTGTMSSADDLDEREFPSPSDNGIAELVTEAANSPGPFRNTQMSKAAHTHRLRKLRAPSKCRECDSLVVFHGAECEECSLACHKKCLETLAIQCGHKKLQGRLHLFGIDFAQVTRNSTDGIPFIIKKCTSEIESRALNIKGIYRINGAKSRVEKLCQAFENGKDLVELSDLFPHDISNVLKLYLRQLPEPLILYRYYNEFIGLAKEAKSIMGEDSEPSHVSIEVNRVIFKIKDLLRQLPPAHYRTLHFLISHLHKVAEHAAENKMTASNLGIIFGPTLIKPRQTEADVSLSSLVDYPYQALMVELFIRHHQMIFDASLSSIPPTNSTLNRCSQSLLVLKEPNSKTSKRHSSIIPSSHSLDVYSSSGHEGKEDIVGSDSIDGVNGVGRTNMNTHAPQVKLRPQRTHYLSRPVSLPVDRLFSDQNEHNLFERESNSSAIAESPESEQAENRTYRSPFVHTHTLRRTWDKQYRHYDVTPRTAMIVANLPSPEGMSTTKKDTTKKEPTKTDTAKAATTTREAASAKSTISMFSQNTPYTVTVRPFRTSRHDSSTSEKEIPIAFRAPRTLQPPPGTFYRPPYVQSKQSVTEKSGNITSPTTVTTLSVTIAAPLATVTVSTTPSALSGSPTMTFSTGSNANHKPEELESNELNTTEFKQIYQRLRNSQHSQKEQETHLV